MTATFPIASQIPVVNPPKKNPSPHPSLFTLTLCKHLHEAKQIHAHLIKSSQISNTYLASRLTEFYAVSDNGSLEYAQKLVTNTIEEPSTFAWNALIRGHLKNKNTHEAVSAFCQMVSESVEPDRFTFTFILKACAESRDSGIGKQIHGQIVKRGLERSLYVRNKLIHVYAVAASVSDARKLFDKTTERDAVTWNTMLEGYASDGEDVDLVRDFFVKIPCKDTVSWNTMMACLVRIGKFEEAIEMFYRMQEGAVKPDRVTLVSALTAMAHLGALAQGRWVHAYISRHKIELDDNLGSALINMYSKCGCIEGATDAFNGMNQQSVDIWNALMAGFAANGHGLKAIQFFSKMTRSNVRPNAITFSCLLNACSHGGLVEEGISHFDKMKREYGIEPDIIHYGCMVDLLCRAGLFDKVETLIKSMPMKPDAVIWKALLGASRIHKNFEIAEKAGLKLIELEPNDHAGYVMLSNICAMAGKWDQVHKMRKTMEDRGIRKPPGCSSIELGGMVHEFVAGDFSHQRKKEIYEMLNEMGERLRLAGYEPDTDAVLLDIDEENMKYNSLIHHSEKLAVAFGFISTKPGTTIRVNNNLRMCTDCHRVMKLLSGIYNRCIIVRDSNRFHHFRNGSCSCMDYW